MSDSSSPKYPAQGSAFRRWLGTACGPGYLPLAPGTWGSLATVIVVAWLVGVEGQFDGFLGVPAPTPSGGSAWLGQPQLFGLSALVIFAFGVVLGHKAHVDWGRHDPGSFVVDEVVGQLIPLLPLLGGPLPVYGMSLAFVLFRVFDVVKPPPCRWLERLPGGVGIMADDVAAGLFALAGVVLLS
ncbi:MAG: phosphatidylglycerophosphatase A [Pseudohongiellaceae bacterium]|jgi:phosphatidylglycerophosphatase A